MPCQSGHFTGVKTTQQERLQNIMALTIHSLENIGSTRHHGFDSKHVPPSPAPLPNRGVFNYIHRTTKQLRRLFPQFPPVDQVLQPSESFETLFLESLGQTR